MTNGSVGPTLSVMADIKMYGADWCGDCRRAKQWFERNDVSYDWIDLEETPEGIEEVLRRNGGRKNIPVIVFRDGSHLTEPTDADLELRMRSLDTGSDLSH